MPMDVKFRYLLYFYLLLPNSLFDIHRGQMRQTIIKERSGAHARV